MRWNILRPCLLWMPTQIGVTGHSMGGGFSITTATYYTGLEREALAKGASASEAKALNKVAAALPVGSYPSALAANSDTSGESGFLCDLGVIAGKYDEFFAAGGNAANTLLSSDLTRKLLAVQTGIQQTSALEEGKIYTNAGNGYILAMYNPKETHAQNHFSIPTAGFVVAVLPGEAACPQSTAFRQPDLVGQGTFQPGRAGGLLHVPGAICRSAAIPGLL